MAARPPEELPFRPAGCLHADADHMQAEKAVEAYAQLAQKNNTMIVPGNMSEVSALIATAMALMKPAHPK